MEKASRMAQWRPSEGRAPARSLTSGWRADLATRPV